MVNENNEAQLSMDVTTEPTAPAEAPVETTTESPVETSTDSSVEPQEGQATTTESQEDTSATATEETPGYPGQDTSVDTSSLQKQLEDQQNRMAQLEQERNQNLVKQQSEQYRSQLIQQGYSPEQAQTNAEQHYRQQLQSLQTTEQYKQRQIQASEDRYLAGLIDITRMFRDRKKHPVPGNDSFDAALDSTIDKLKAKKEAFRKRVYIDNNEEPEIFRDD